MNDADRCPHCASENIRIESSRDRYPPRPERGGEAAATRPVARSFWLRCEDCGNDWFAIRRLNP
jgi:hypothetical protein